MYSLNLSTLSMSTSTWPISYMSTNKNVLEYTSTKYFRPMSDVYNLSMNKIHICHNLARNTLPSVLQQVRCCNWAGWTLHITLFTLGFVVALCICRNYKVIECCRFVRHVSSLVDITENMIACLRCRVFIINISEQIVIYYLSVKIQAKPKPS